MPAIIPAIFSIIKVIFVIGFLFKAIQYLVTVFKSFGFLGAVTHILTFIGIVAGGVYLFVAVFQFKWSVGIALLALFGIYAGFMLSRLLGIRVAKAAGCYKE
jgi:predicted lysophospholipase L1 biosynthesis ABC-type transport system permease subunit